MEFKENEKLKNLQHKTDQIAAIMNENIALLCSRGEKTNDIHNKSEEVKRKATLFQKQSKKARNRTSWWGRILHLLRHGRL